MRSAPASVPPPPPPPPPVPEGVRIMEALDAIDPAALSPREALDALYRLKSLERS